MNAGPGAAMIAAERLRQVTGEGWSAAHDDEHDPGALAHAARGYLVKALRQVDGIDQDAFPTPALWPWDPSWWKPSPDPLRNLVKAGALIAAELDRLVRQMLAEHGLELPCGVHTLCGQPATALVVGSGHAVCDQHRRAYLDSELSPIGSPS